MWEWQWTIYTLFLLLAAATMGVVAVGAWQKRDVPGSTAFLLLIGAMMLWAVTYGLQIAGATEGTKLFWANANHIAVAAVPIAWIGFALQFTGRDHLLTPRTLGTLSVVPTAYLVLVWTNPRHELIRQTFGIKSVNDGSLLLIDQAFGLAFWVHAAYGYALMAAGAVLFAQLFVWAPKVYRRQVGLLLLGAVVPMAANLAFHTDLYVPSNFDLTPFSFVATGVLFFAAIYHYQLLDLVPIARETVVDTLSEGIIVIDSQQQIVDINDAAATILKLDGDAVIGTSVHQTLPEIVTETEPSEDRSTVSSEISCEIDATPRKLAVTKTPLVDVNGNLIGRTMTLRDVTEKRSLEAALSAQLDEVMAVNRELETFTTAISHDLRQPARTTERYIDRVRRSEPELSAENDEILAVAQTNAERMQTMLSDLLEYSRIERNDDQFEPVSLAAVVDQATTSLRFSIEETDTTVSVGELPTVSGIEHQLVRLFQNLISNAIRYSGPAPPVISVEATTTETEHVLTVTDAGVGIDPDELEYVFELFTRGQHAEQTPGTGAGLALCKKIVEQHGGSVDIESTLGEGTTVIVRLPKRE
ncbi:sensor histidine kinase [Natronorubrum sulfidifaciens]|uniref:histidine kinase n=1 Tax=Natronorubrum sulfidifaciens JCM 14089 TaxID=1230460 RepID=L9VUR9_9EURY|nr:histidine kinase N-terminal 7TM domain-containing protein [Natronorubrum sulfidifaciens]ELY40930.1 multi-sensor signal transduction histidine kinase [Natronorubrum sulfidifaciens JCM 14089]